MSRSSKPTTTSARLISRPASAIPPASSAPRRGAGSERTRSRTSARTTIAIATGSSTERAGPPKPAANCGMTWASRRPKGSPAIQLARPVVCCPMASGIRARPHTAITPKAICTGRAAAVQIEQPRCLGHDDERRVVVGGERERRGDHPRHEQTRPRRHACVREREQRERGEQREQLVGACLLGVPDQQRAARRQCRHDQARAARDQLRARAVHDRDQRYPGQRRQRAESRPRRSRRSGPTPTRRSSRAAEWTRSAGSARASCPGRSGRAARCCPRRTRSLGDRGDRDAAPRRARSAPPPRPPWGPRAARAPARPARAPAAGADRVPPCRRSRARMLGPGPAMVAEVCALSKAAAR